MKRSPLRRKSPLKASKPMRHKIDPIWLRCVDCLTDLRYMASHPNAPCLPDKMLERNRRRIALVLYGEAEKDRRCADYGDTLLFVQSRISVEEFDRRQERRRFAGQRAAEGWMKASEA